MHNEDYRPVNITFDVAPDETPMPENFGEFKQHDEVMKFLADAKLTTVNQALTVSRHMDAYEKKEIREQYIDVLENSLPKLEKEHLVISAELSDVKSREKEAAERVSAAISEAKILAKEVKRGLKEIRVDDLYTFRVPYRGRYYFYTWIDSQLKLCRISDIPEHEKTEIWNAMAANEEFIDNHFAEADAETKS